MHDVIRPKGASTRREFWPFLDLFLLGFPPFSSTRFIRCHCAVWPVTVRVSHEYIAA